MPLIMGIILVALSLLKFLDWDGFTVAFAKYDLIASDHAWYARAYPIIELALGILYLTKNYLPLAAIVTLVIMAAGTIGILKNLMSPNRVRCACMGTVIKVPLTWFTVVEDMAMVVMAIMILGQ